MLLPLKLVQFVFKVYFVILATGVLFIALGIDKFLIGPPTRFPVGFEISTGAILLILGLGAFILRLCELVWPGWTILLAMVAAGIACSAELRLLFRAGPPAIYFLWDSETAAWTGVVVSAFCVSRILRWFYTDHRDRHYKAVSLPPLETGPKAKLTPRVRTARSEDHVTILHLSDLHFRPGHALDNPRTPALNHLQAVLLKRYAKKIDLVVVTGDVVDGELFTKNTKTAFDEVKQYLLGLCKALELDEEALLIIPGNHDYRRKGLFANPDAIRGFREIFGYYGRHALFEFKNLNFSLFCACFDSNVGLSRAELATGYVNMAEVNRLEQMVRDQPLETRALINNAFKIALVHHHILPVADAEEMITHLERRRMRKIWGAPEVMILKNACIFLRRLQNFGFRLVLHGHLHVRSCLQTVAYADKEQSGRTLEIIAAGSGCLPDQWGRNSFNIVEILKDHVVKVSPVDFTDGGDDHETVLPRTAEYDSVRLERYDSWLTPQRQPIRCKTYACYWDVYLPSGDVTITQVLRGLRGDDPKKAPEFILPAREPTLTSVHFEVRYLTETDSPLPKTEPLTEAELKEYVKAMPLDNSNLQRIRAFRIRFIQPLPAGQSVDLACRWRIRGCMYRSAQDKANWGLGAQANFDEVAHVIRWPCERFLLNLRFYCRPIRYLPLQIWTDIQDVHGQYARSEMDSGHLAKDYTYPGQKTDWPRTAEDATWVPQAYLSLHRPQLGFRYALRWELSQSDPMDSSMDLQRTRQQLCKLKPNPAFHPKLQKMLADFLASIGAILAVGPAEPASLAAYLFGFDNEKRWLDCIGSTSPADDPLRGAHISWGKDTIGAAFRRNEVLTFSRHKFNETRQTGERLEVLPDNVHALVAVPIGWHRDPAAAEADEDRENWPVGVVAVVSYERMSAFESQILSLPRPKTMHLRREFNEVFWKELGATDCAATE